jgi:hypothetical protein
MKTRITTLAAASLLCLAAPANAEQNLQRKAAVPADAAIEVANVSGRVEITAWDRNEVALEATLAGDEDLLVFEAEGCDADHPRAAGGEPARRTGERQSDGAGCPRRTAHQFSQR